MIKNLMVENFCSTFSFFPVWVWAAQIHRFLHVIRTFITKIHFLELWINSIIAIPWTAVVNLSSLFQKKKTSFVNIGFLKFILILQCNCLSQLWEGYSGCPSTFNRALISHIKWYLQKPVILENFIRRLSLI